MAKNNVPVKEEGKLKTSFSSIRSYFRSVYNELKKVHWPGRQQLIAYTGVVLFSVVLVAFIIWVFDKGLSYLLQLLSNTFA